MMCDTRATRVPESLGREYRDRSTSIAVFEKQNKKNEKKKRKKKSGKGEGEGKERGKRGKKEGINKKNPTFQHVHPSTDVQIA